MGAFAGPPTPPRGGEGRQPSLRLAARCRKPLPSRERGWGEGATPAIPEQHHFADQPTMVAALGAFVVAQLQQTIDQRGHAQLRRLRRQKPRRRCSTG